MRVPDVLQKNVVYLGHTDDCGIEVVRGTGFFVTLPANYGGHHLYLVTAMHVANMLGSTTDVFAIGNGPADKSGRMNLGRTPWWFHPTDDTVNAAVMPLLPTLPLDFAYMSLEKWLADEVIAKGGIGIGDDVFTAGLYSPLRKLDVHLPIIRMGNIAMLPPGHVLPIEIPPKRYVYAEGYLIESHSYGGMSGSPVFVRETRYIPAKADGTHDVQLHVGGRMYLLGIFQGHWTLSPTDINSNEDIRSGPLPRGLSFVVPGHQIMDILNRPELMTHRKQIEALREKEAFLQRNATTADAASADKPFTKADFETALKKASRKTMPLAPKDRPRKRG